MKFKKNGDFLKKGVGCVIKLSPAVRKETKYIAVWTLLLSVLMQAVFLVLRLWNVGVLLGNLLTGTIAVLNFLLLGITVQKAVEREEKDARSLMKLSQTMRMLMLFVVLVIGVALPVFDTWACIIPIFFTRIALLFRPMFGMTDEGTVQSSDTDATTREEGDSDGGTNTEE